MNIIEKVNTLLKEEKRAYAANGRIRGGLGSFSVGIGGGWTTVGQIPQILNDVSTVDAIKSPNAELLIKLYAAADPNEKNIIKTYLLEQLRRNSEFFDVAYFVLFVLYKTGGAVNAIHTAKSNLKGDTENAYSNFLGMLSKIVYYEYAYIDSNTYQLIKTAMQGETEPDFGLKEKINLAELKLLERELDGINQEVNSDRDKI